jgi:hypothetical protein
MYKLKNVLLEWAENYLVPFVDMLFLNRESYYNHDYLSKGFVRWYSVQSAQWGKWHRIEKDWLNSTPVTITMCGRRVRKQKTQTLLGFPDHARIHCI